MPSFVPLRYEQIMPQMVARLVGRSDLSDVAPTSQAKHLLAAHARQLEQAYYQASLIKLDFSIDTATGDALDARAKDIQPGLLKRILSQYARGYVVFSRNSVSGTAQVQAGQIVTDAAGNQYATLAACSWSATSVPQITGHVVGQDSAPTAVQAILAGASGNVSPGGIVGFGSKPNGVDAVTNLAAFGGGADKETDDSYRSRLKNYVASLACATPQALESAVIGQQDANGNTILYAKCVEDISALGSAVLYIDDGTGTAGIQAQVTTPEVMTASLAGPPTGAATGTETALQLAYYPVVPTAAVTVTSSTRGILTSPAQYILQPTNGLVRFIGGLSVGEVITATYSYYTGLVALAQMVVDGDPNNPTQYPGVRAAGIYVAVAVPQILDQNVALNVDVADTYDRTSVQAAVQAAVVAYIDSLAIGQDVLVAEIVAAAMDVPGCTNVALTGTLTADVAIVPGQLARAGTVTFGA